MSVEFLVLEQSYETEDTQKQIAFYQVDLGLN